MITFKSTEWTRFLWKSHCEGDFELIRALNEGSDKIADSFKEFANELFHDIYQGHKFDSDSGPEWAKIAREALSIPEIQDKLSACTGQRLQSGLMAASLIKKVVRNPPKSKVAEANVEAALQDLLAEDDPSLAEQLKGFMDTQPSDAPVDWDAAELREALRKAAVEVQTELDETADLIRVLGSGSEAGDISKKVSPVTAKLAKAVRDNPKLQEIIKMAGKLQALAKQSQKAKPRKGTNEVSGVELGFDLAKLLPSELALLTDPALEAVFARKLQEKTLAQYSITEKPEENQGPVIILIDSSASMQFRSRDTWAAAVALAFFQIAQNQKRNFHVIIFNGGVKESRSFPAKEKVSATDLLTTVSLSPSGGTNFSVALAEARKVLIDSGDYKKADVIMLTDGKASVSESFKASWNKTKEDTGARLFTIYVVSQTCRDLEDCSDESIVLPKFIKEQHKLTNIFSQL